MSATREARVVVADYQRGTPQQLNATNDLLVATMDNIVGNFMTKATRYAGMGVAVDVSNKRVVVGAGTLYKGGPGYALEEAFTVDLALATSVIPDGKQALVAILADGYEDPNAEKAPATFLDPSKKPANQRDVWPTIEAITPTRKVRYVSISAPVGAADVQPALPTFSPALCHVATVTINKDGIVLIAQNLATRIETLDDVAEQADALQAWRAVIEPQVQALLASVSGLALSIAGLQNIYAEIAKLQAQLNALQQQANNQGSQQNTGSAPNLSGFDLFLDLTRTDVAMTGNGALVKDGLRFPSAAFDDQILVPQSAFSADLTYTGGRYLSPKRTSVPYLSSKTNNQGYGSAQCGVISFTATYRGMGVSRTRWDPTLQASSVGQLLLAGDPNQLFASAPNDLGYQTAWGDWRSPTTELIRQAGYAKDLTGREAWSRITGTEQFNARYVLAQPFTTASSEMIDGVTLAENRTLPYFAPTVDCVVMADLSGSPDPTRCLGRATWTGGDQSKPNPDPQRPVFTFDTPIAKKAGDTLWFVFLVPGSSTNMFSFYGLAGEAAPLQFNPNFGSAKTFANGYWNVIGYITCIQMTVNRASFSGSGVLRVPMGPLQLAGGMDAIDLVTPALVPPGCSIDYEVQIGGVPVPVAALASGQHPLLARPGNLPLTMLLSYTESTAPILDLNGGIAPNFKAGARYHVTRAALTLHHVSDTRVPPANVTKITETVQLDAFDTASHTFTAKLLTGASYTVQTPPTDTKDVVQGDGSIKRTFTWSLGAAVLGHKVALDGVTADAAKPFSGRRADWTAAP